MAEVLIPNKVILCCGDSLHFLRDQPDNRYDSVVTDPPYALVSISKRFGADDAAPAKAGKTGAYARASAGFMGKKWDTGETAFATEFWSEVLRVLKPGGFVLAFGGTRTYHRLACAIEDAGFEIRDMIQWVYGSGFPKSHDVSKGIDKAAGATREVVGRARRAGKEHGTYAAMAGDSDITAPATPAAQEWEGWGTALKPANEPIVLARKPLSEKTVAANVLKWGTGAINIDGCRVGTADNLNGGRYSDNKQGDDGNTYGSGINLRSAADYVQPQGRFPANVIHDGSDEVVGMFPSVGDSHPPANEGSVRRNEVFGSDSRPREFHSGSAARFFYSAKADSDDRLGSKHPTVKPVDLMQWLIRLVTPPGGLVLDPFAGTGTTAEAAVREGMRCTLVERETEYQGCIRRRMRLVMAGPDERRRESLKASGKVDLDSGPLFASLSEPAPAETASAMVAKLRSRLRPVVHAKISAGDLE